jgi:hypothetical protein
MIRRWEVDDATVVEANIRFLRKVVLTVNGKLVSDKLTMRESSQFAFALADGRKATFSIQRQFATQPELSLRLDGRLMVETGKKPLMCSACASEVKPNDRFCAKCGYSMPPAEVYVHRRNVSKATGAIAVLAVLFAISGIAMFFVTKGKAAPLLTKLEQMDPTATYPTAIHGVNYTVAALRERVVWESLSVLIVSLVLAAVMAGLAIWGRRAPLPAVLIAAATYAVVAVTGALIDPKSIAQGLFIKVLVITLLFRGIKAALALRASNA